MLRTQFLAAFGWGAGLVISIGSIVARPARAEEPRPDATASDAAPPVATATDQASAAALEVQRALGGPLTNQFPQLQPAPETSPWWKQFSGSPDAGAPPVATPPGNPWPTWWTPARPRDVVTAAVEAPAGASPVTPQIAALRRTAAELEMIGNRLEEIELYQQADSLRELAQRLRADARETLARIRGEQNLGGAPPVGESHAHTGRESVGASVGPYPTTGAEYGGSVSHDSAASHDHNEASGRGHAHDERSVIVGPAPE